MKSKEQIRKEADEFNIQYKTWIIIYKGSKFHQEFFNKKK